MVYRSIRRIYHLRSRSKEVCHFGFIKTANFQWPRLRVVYLWNTLYKPWYTLYVIYYSDDFTKWYIQVYKLNIPPVHIVQCDIITMVHVYTCIILCSSWGVDSALCAEFFYIYCTLHIYIHTYIYVRIYIHVYALILHNV